MSYPPAPPPQPMPPQPGPAGAYGTSTTGPAGQPVPGQGPDPRLRDEKPGTIKALVVMLYISAVFYLLIELYNISVLIQYPNPLGFVSAAIGLYGVVQGLINPVYISRGRRWAWIWSLIGSIMGTLIGLVGIVASLAMPSGSNGPLVFAVALAYTAYFGTFFGLLVSSSAREYILMQRMRRSGLTVPSGEATGTDGNGEPQRPEKRPGAITFVLLAMTSLILISIAVSVFMRLAYAATGYRAEGTWSDAIDTWLEDVAEFNDFVIVSVIVMAVMIALLVPAMIGLAKGKFWGRVYSAIALGILVLPFIQQVLFTLSERQDEVDAGSSTSASGQPSDGAEVATQAFTVNVVLLGIGFLLIVLSFIFLFGRSGRAWTPAKPSPFKQMLLAQSQQQAGPGGASQGTYGGPQQAQPQYGPAPQAPPPQYGPTNGGTPPAPPPNPGPQQPPHQGHNQYPFPPQG